MTAIRRAILEDAATLARLHAQGLAEPWNAEAFARLLQMPGVFAFLAADGANAAPMSFILVQVAADQSEILALSTASAARRKGLARALLETAGAEAVRRAAAEMFLEVACDNTAALSLYGEVGFAVAGRRRGYYARGRGQAVDALLLRACLPFGR